MEIKSIKWVDRFRKKLFKSYTFDLCRARNIDKLDLDLFLIQYIRNYVTYHQIFQCIKDLSVYLYIHNQGNITR